MLFRNQFEMISSQQVISLLSYFVFVVMCLFHPEKYLEYVFQCLMKILDDSLSDFHSMYLNEYANMFSLLASAHNSNLGR